ncbi:(2Fe-2S) ferredoxin domain-containing protein [Acidipropionibacterium jensenii]|uniref:Ferredoxin n=2 Tax=Acidipropionibacterium jensenii TaxID=1749 RepID=A0A3S4V766_9ACTN|nr:(2Fe-2S) ferredoxin domain-containing protein [Acidipropionibacterium jensenii]MDN5976366.1 (2Fe-2S) ferredoxin domain-containing protein [Acidipropionibacterium jensenii]MDN5995606.1 (2Fe-2S) ferredoxin domain-containing protein [Acidipropionibacterium jensenii]MDN6425652.1 (2Fe-2S) ferredoxin domain-containing protein [Acidipropionibacterium jensenii]MDN6479432.1 (2Fe-2S) ferredoxin domain-containing protein [Acidipropionibacterium jensenii]MDN6511831.1 (2Fe-2S) ferredoxin domain-containi
MMSGTEGRPEARLLVGLTFPDAGECAGWAATFAAAGWGHAQVQGDGMSLHSALDEIARHGSCQIELMGMTTLDGPIAVSWLRRVAGAWLRAWEAAHPDGDFHIRVCRHVLRPGEEPPAAGSTCRENGVDPGSEGVADASVITRTAVARAEDHPGADWGWREVTGREAGLTSAAWQEVPPVRYHLLVCRGPRCNARGGDRTHSALSAELHRRGVADQDVLMTPTGCMYPCNHAPLVVVHPDGKWMSLTAAEVPGALDDLLGPENA